MSEILLENARVRIPEIPSDRAEFEFEFEFVKSPRNASLSRRGRQPERACGRPIAPMDSSRPESPPSPPSWQRVRFARLAPKWSPSGFRRYAPQASILHMALPLRSESDDVFPPARSFLPSRRRLMDSEPSRVSPDLSVSGIGDHLRLAPPSPENANPRDFAGLVLEFTDSTVEFVAPDSSGSVRKALSFGRDVEGVPLVCVGHTVG
jgi:hypothetical protein